MGIQTSKDRKEGFQVELNADEQENENTLEVLGHSTWFRVLGTLCSMCRWNENLSELTSHFREILTRLHFT